MNDAPQTPPAAGLPRAPQDRPHGALPERGRAELLVHDLATLYTCDPSLPGLGLRFDDAVTFGTFPLDVHEVNPKDKVRSSRIVKTMPYEIPLRSLLPAGLEGLLVAGRCISGTHEAHASYRVTGTCMGMGQAAGLAAAMAAAENVPPASLVGGALKPALLQRGVGLLEAKKPEEIVGDLYGDKLVWH